MSYDDAINKILQEQYFGGSPFEQASGIKKHIVFEDSGGDKGKVILKRFFEDHAPYYSRDIEDIEKWPEHRGGNPTKASPLAAYVENKDVQTEYDKIIQEELGGAELEKVDVQGCVDGSLYVYTLSDKNLVDSLKPLGFLAVSTEDRGLSTNFDLDEWQWGGKGTYSGVMVGHILNERLGAELPSPDGVGQPIRKVIPLLKNTGGKDGMIYHGPYKNLKDWSNKECSVEDAPKVSEEPEQDGLGFQKLDKTPGSSRFKQHLQAQNEKPLDVSQYMPTPRV